VKQRREKLESAFVSLLTELQPSAGYLKLFRAIVLDVWRARRVDADHHRKEIERRVQGLREKLDRVDDACLHEGRIDQMSYERQRDKLRQDLTLAQMSLHDASVEELDVESVLAFAEVTLTNASRFWTDGTLDQKQRFQSSVFPEGLTFDGEKLGTTVICLAFNRLPSSKVEESSVASPPGFDPFTVAGRVEAGLLMGTS